MADILDNDEWIQKEKSNFFKSGFSLLEQGNGEFSVFGFRICCKSWIYICRLANTK